MSPGAPGEADILWGCRWKPREGRGAHGSWPVQTPGNGQGRLTAGVNGHWEVSRRGPESQAWRSPGPSPPLPLQSRDRKMVGDITGAQSYASTAKCLNIFSLVLGLLLIIIFIIVFATRLGPNFRLHFSTF